MAKGKRLTIKGIISQLAATTVSGEVYNQYGDDGSQANSTRRNNLTLYLNQMKKLGPSIILVGEAPGYRGCRLTGIPLTSEAVMLDEVDELGILGKNAGYRKTDEFPKPVREITATIVWETLVRLKLPPILLWNTFPFHPHRSGQPFSNRKPLRKEILSSQNYASVLIDLFEIQTVIAMGGVAARSLDEMGHKALKIRHPAQGGKNDFVAGLKAIFKK